MGAVNYGTTYYMYQNGKRQQDKDITIGLKPRSDYNDDESGYNDYVSYFDDPEQALSRCDYDRATDDYSREETEYYLEESKLPSHYKVTIEPGYYEGFYLKIEGDDPWALDSKKKAEYQKDITCLKRLLLELMNDIGLKVVHPGWCTSYCDEKKGLKELNEFIKNLRQEIKDVETYAHYMKRCAA